MDGRVVRLFKLCLLLLLCDAISGVEQPQPQQQRQRWMIPNWTIIESFPLFRPLDHPMSRRRRRLTDFTPLRVLRMSGWCSSGLDWYKNVPPNLYCYSTQFIARFIQPLPLVPFLGFILHTRREQWRVIAPLPHSPTALNLMVSRQRKDHQAIQFAQVVGGGINPRGLIYNPGNESELCISVTALSRC